MRVVADSRIPFIQEYFSTGVQLTLRPGRLITRADLKKADILLVRSITRVDETLLANTPVRFVGSITAGQDHLDTEWLDAMKIPWQIAKGFNAPPVANYILSVIAALQNRLSCSNQPLKAAVIGAGNVGRLVIHHLKQIGFDVDVCDPIREQNEELNPAFSYTQWQRLRDLDVISLHVPLTKTGDHPTYQMIDAEFLQRQKPGCLLINTSRGAVIDANALLTHGTHLHWCFDVWENEPNLSLSILERALIATPHIAGYSIQSKQRGIDMIYRAIHANDFSLEDVSNRMSITHLQKVHTWQEAVLKVFNPLILTKQMRTMLLNAHEVGSLFDEMRHQFQDRYEFAFTELSPSDFSLEDQTILAGLGFQFRDT